MRIFYVHKYVWRKLKKKKLIFSTNQICDVWRVVVRISYEIRAANFPNNWHKGIQIYVNPNDGLCKAEKAWTEYKFSFFTWSFFMRFVFFMNIPYKPAQSAAWTEDKNTFYAAERQRSESKCDILWYFYSRYTIYSASFFVNKNKSAWDYFLFATSKGRKKGT